MPRASSPIPPITPVERDLTVEAVREIIAIAEAAQARRRELTAAMRAALQAGDQELVVKTARQLVRLEEEIEE
jgi:hypothetical protein